CGIAVAIRREDSKRVRRGLAQRAGHLKSRFRPISRRDRVPAKSHGLLDPVGSRAGYARPIEGEPVSSTVVVDVEIRRCVGPGGRRRVESDRSGLYVGVDGEEKPSLQRLHRRDSTIDWASSRERPRGRMSAARALRGHYTLLLRLRWRGEDLDGAVWR